MGTQFTLHDRKTMLDDARDNLGLVRYCEPFPIEGDPRSVAMGLLPRDTFAALRALRDAPGGEKLIHKSYHMKIVVAKEDDKLKVNTLRIRSDRQFYTPNNTFITMDNTHPLWRITRDWIDRAAAVDEEIGKARRLLDLLFVKCNTPGQINRVMPEITHLLKGSHRRTLEEAKRGSPIPKGMKPHMDAPEWAERRQQLGDLITKAMLVDQSLPTTPDIWIAGAF